MVRYVQYSPPVQPSAQPTIVYLHFYHSWSGNTNIPRLSPCHSVLYHPGHQPTHAGFVQYKSTAMRKMQTANNVPMWVSNNKIRSDLSNKCIDCPLMLQEIFLTLTIVG